MENLNELLLTVQRPARYVGGEWNSVKKEWTGDTVKVLFAFPDVYEIGMSYLGMKILYGILNNRDDCLCERVFSPWPDFEEALRKNRLSIFSLESRRPMKDFDIIGFSLAYELTYTNALNLLDLGGIPVRSSERTDEHPLIIAGGPSCYNPEPMADFFDAFVIGDGEEVIEEIIEMYKGHRVKGEGHRAKGIEHRANLFKKLAGIKGVYVPSLYKVDYNADRTIMAFYPAEDSVPAKIEKRIIRDLDSAFYPVKQIVPNIPIVHDRIALEIMRGCKHACGFCQATAVYRPCRERSEGEILRLAKEAYEMTGYDEISLLSLSSGDYSRIKGLIESLNGIFSRKAVSISVPSLRIEDILKDLPALISKVKKSGLTFAPEAGSESVRKLINKEIDMGKMFRAAAEYYKFGWRRVKLYFMIGFPGEKDRDVLAITELICKISNLKRDLDGKSAAVTASINPFIPKPHTVFQWEAMDGLESLGRKRDLLRGSMRSRLVELDLHSFDMSCLEAAISRGDRRLAAVIFEAWKTGSRFDGWQDLFNFELWRKSFERNGIDLGFYAHRKRGFDEVLPWDFIDIGVKKETLLRAARDPSRARFDKPLSL